MRNISCKAASATVAPALAAGPFAASWARRWRLAGRGPGTQAPEQLQTVTLLGYYAPLDWSRTPDGLVVRLPDHKPCKHAYVLKLVS